MAPWRCGAFRFYFWIVLRWNRERLYIIFGSSMQNAVVFNAMFIVELYSVELCTNMLQATSICFVKFRSLAFWLLF